MCCSGPNGGWPHEDEPFYLMARISDFARHPVSAFLSYSRDKTLVYPGGEVM